MVAVQTDADVERLQSGDTQGFGFGYFAEARPGPESRIRFDTEQLARNRLHRVRKLGTAADRLEQRIATLLCASGSSLPQLPGIGVLTAAKLVGESGDVARYRSHAAFAAASGTAPIPASSGQRQRHRLNRGGNRQLNRALHTMALVQTRWDPRAEAYLTRRLGEGRSRLEAIRALKWHLARGVYRTMLADARRTDGAA